MFKNLTLFQLSPKATRAALDAPFADRLAQNPLRDVGPQELSTHGFVSPFGDDPNAAYTHTVGTYTLFAVGGQHRLLPGGVVNAAVKAKIAKIQQETGRKIGRKERQSFKDEVINELLPKAFIRTSRAQAYLDHSEGWVVIDTGSTKAAEALVSTVRLALDTFPAVPVLAEESVRAILTQWITEGVLPEGLAFGDSCELKDPASKPAATARIRNQDLGTDDVREHLKSGKQVSQISLVFQERLRFTLTDELVFKQFKLLEQATASLGNTERGDAATELDAQFALLTLEVDQLLEQAKTWFKIGRPAD